MRKAICVATVEDDKILLVKKRDTWILPGGKPNINESDIDCLIREISEELPNIILSDIIFFDQFIGSTPFNKEDKLTAYVYLAGSSGAINTAAEISEAVWTNDPERFNLSDITKQIVYDLRLIGYL